MRDPNQDPNPYYQQPPGMMPQGDPLGQQAFQPMAGQPQRRNTDQFREMLDVLYRGKWVILVTFVAIVGATVLYNMSVEPVYESYTLLLVDTGSGSDFSSMLEQASPLGMTGDDRALANELVILRESFGISETVAQQLKAYHEQGEPITAWLTEDQEVELSVNQVAQILQDYYIRVNPEGRGVDVVRITASSTVPSEAALMANLFSEAYVERTRESSRARVSASREFLQEQEGILLGNLRTLENDIQDYMAREGAVDLDAEATHTVTQLAELRAMRDEARIELQMKSASNRTLEQELEQINPRLAERIASGVEQEITATQSRMAELEATREQIYLVNPDLRGLDLSAPVQNRNSKLAELTEIQGQIDQLQQKVSRLSRQYVDEVMNVGGIDISADGGGLAQIAGLKRQVIQGNIEVSGLQAKIDVLNQRMGVYEAKLKDIPTQAIQLAQLQRDRQATERMYLFLEEKLQEARVTEASELGYAEVIREALVPVFPVRPNKTRNLALGAILGIMLGVGLAIAIKRLDKRLYRPEDLRQKGYSVLGVIPKLDGLIRDDFGGKEYINLEGREISTALVSLLVPMSPLVEAYRQIRTNIQFSRPDQIVQTIMITSSNAGEGKTITSANLSVVMAQAGRRTCLIDADLRRPRGHRVFGLKRDPGLVDLLFDSGPLDLERFSTGIDDLYVIPAGTTVPNPSELLGSLKMRELISRLREHFDIIIFDTPPVMIATDSVLLATQCDASIVVTHAGRTEEFELEESMEALRSVGAFVVGNLLNAFDASMAHGYKYKYKYYKYGYGYRYGYGRYGAKDKEGVS